MNKYAYVTIINTEKYINGVLCLNESLKNVHSIYPLYAVISGEASKNIETKLKKSNIKVIKISENNINVSVEVKEKNIKGGHENWNYSFDKLIVYSLNQFEKVVFLDADLYVVENLDHLFEKSHMTAATSGKLFPGKETWTKLNSGLMVIEPEEGLLNKIIDNISFLNNIDGYVGDQEVIWNYYSDWKEKVELQLDEKYNVFFEHLDYYMKNLNYTLFNKNSEKNILVVHFVTPKPWLLSKKLRIKYILYNCINFNFRIVKLLLDYFTILNKVEKEKI